MIENSKIQERRVSALKSPRDKQRDKLVALNGLQFDIEGFLVIYESRLFGGKDWLICCKNGNYEKRMKERKKTQG